jgi:hypothetical protein
MIIHIVDNSAEQYSGDSPYFIILCHHNSFNRYRGNFGLMGKSIWRWELNIHFWEIDIHIMFF